MADYLTVYEVGDRFVTMDRQGYARVYVVAADGRAYVEGFVPDELRGGDDER